MAGIFDWASYMGPRGSTSVVPYAASGEYIPRGTPAAEAARIAGLLGSDPIPGERPPAVRPVSGEYIPRGNPVSPASRVAGILGSDPIPGERPPAVRGSVVGGGSGGTGGGSGGGGGGRGGSGKSVVPRNMKQVGPAIREIFGERVAPERLTGPQATAAAEGAGGAAGRGILGRALGVLGGPVGLGVQMAVTPGELAPSERTREEEISQAQQAVENMGPEVAQSANQWAQGVGQRAAQNATGGPTWAELLSYGVTPNQPSIEPDIAPEVASAAGAAVADEEEANRQVIQQGAAEGLRTGAVSRPEMAQAVVEADAQREGVELKPQELKNRVNEELTQMRTMDNDDLSRYVSYALIGTGLLASALDKTGKAGDMFAASYERQLDRNLQAGINQEKMAAAAADRQIKEKDLERKVAKDAADVRLGEGNLKVKEVTLEQTKRKTEGVLDKWVNQAAVDRANLELTRRGQDLANQRAQLQAETTRRGQDMAQENAQLGSAVRLKTARISAQARQAAAKAARGEPVTTKDALGILSEVSGSKALGGKKLGKTAQQAIAQTLRNEMRANPGANPIGIIQREAAKLQPTGNWFFGGDLDYPAPTR